ncbi:MAG: type II secretion system protein M [Desulfocapsa sp.]|nr:type II secretion system protein M [Desulfocapsa sp.]
MSTTVFTKKLQSLLDKSGWQRMAKREKLMVGGLIVMVTALLFFSLIVSPLLDSRQLLQKSLAQKQVELQKIRDLQKEYQVLQHTSGDIQERLKKRPEKFTLFAFIEQQATAAGIKQQINYLKPSEVESKGPLRESRVDMKLQKITLADLVKFLEGVESYEKVVSVSRISIQEYGKEEGYLNAVLQIVTFRAGEPTQ